MSVDLAIDYNTGDLLVAPNKDLQLRTGLAEVEQRIRVRLRIPQGEWLLDPTGGSLGSTLKDAARLPVYRAITEIPLIVREALEPMTDISVRNVDARINPDSSTSIDVVIVYALIDNGVPSEDQALSFTTTIAG